MDGNVEEAFGAVCVHTIASTRDVVQARSWLNTGRGQRRKKV